MSKQIESLPPDYNNAVTEPAIAIAGPVGFVPLPPLQNHQPQINYQL